MINSNYQIQLISTNYFIVDRGKCSSQELNYSLKTNALRSSELLYRIIKCESHIQAVSYIGYQKKSLHTLKICDTTKIPSQTYAL